MTKSSIIDEVIMDEARMKRTTTVTIEGPLVQLVDRYIDAENRRKAPSKLSFNALVAAALHHYITDTERRVNEEAA